MTREELENSTIKELIEAGEIPFSREIENTDRASFAQLATDIHSMLIGSYESSSIEEQVTDIICNLRHLCDAHGIMFLEMNSQAADHYFNEILNTED